MVIENEFFRERQDVTNLDDDNVNIFKVTYFKPSGKYYTDEFYEMKIDDMYMFDLVDAFKEKCNSYKGMIAVCSFNENHKTEYPLMINAYDR